MSSLGSRRLSLPWPRWVTGLVASALLVVGWVLALRHLPTVHRVDWWLIALAVGCVPVTMASNAAEFSTASALAGQQVSRLGALRVTVLGTAANVLPLPGAAVVRVRALRQGGAGTGWAVEITALIGVIWLAVAAVAGGSLLAVGNRPGAGAALAGPGMVILAGGVVRLSRRCPQAPPAMFGRVIGIELVTVLVDGTRLWLFGRALHFGVPYATAVSLTVASVVASAIGVVPGGLGLREGLAAALGSLLGLPAATGFTVVGASRLAEYAVVAPVAAVLLSRREGR